MARTYTAAQRAEALSIPSPTVAAQRTGIPEGTIIEWRRQAGIAGQRGTAMPGPPNMPPAPGMPTGPGGPVPTALPWYKRIPRPVLIAGGIAAIATVYVLYRRYKAGQEALDGAMVDPLDRRYAYEPGLNFPSFGGGGGGTTDSGGAEEVPDADLPYQPGERPAPTAKNTGRGREGAIAAGLLPAPASIPATSNTYTAKGGNVQSLTTTAVAPSTAYEQSQQFSTPVLQSSAKARTLLVR